MTQGQKPEQPKKADLKKMFGESLRSNDSAEAKERAEAAEGIRDKLAALKNAMKASGKKAANAVETDRRSVSPNENNAPETSSEETSSSDVDVAATGETTPETPPEGTQFVSTAPPEPFTVDDVPESTDEETAESAEEVPPAVLAATEDLLNAYATFDQKFGPDIASNEIRLAFLNGRKLEGMNPSEFLELIRDREGVSEELGALYADVEGQLGDENAAIDSYITQFTEKSTVTAIENTAYAMLDEKGITKAVQSIDKKLQEKGINLNIEGMLKDWVNFIIDWLKEIAYGLNALSDNEKKEFIDDQYAKEEKELKLFYYDDDPEMKRYNQNTRFYRRKWEREFKRHLADKTDSVARPSLIDIVENNTPTAVAENKEEEKPKENPNKKIDGIFGGEKNNEKDLAATEMQEIPYNATTTIALNQTELQHTKQGKKTEYVFKKSKEGDAQDITLNEIQRSTDRPNEISLIKVFSKETAKNFSLTELNDSVGNYKEEPIEIVAGVWLHKKNQGSSSDASTTA